MFKGRSDKPITINYKSWSWRLKSVNITNRICLHLPSLPMNTKIFFHNKPKYFELRYMGNSDSLVSGVSQAYSQL